MVEEEIQLEKSPFNLETKIIEKMEEEPKIVVKDTQQDNALAKNLETAGLSHDKLQELKRDFDEIDTNGNGLIDR